MTQQSHIIIDPYVPGRNNSEESLERVRKAKTYKPQSTVCIVPTRGQISSRAVQSWLNLMAPMNQALVRMFATGYEVGDAYSAMIGQILDSHLANFKYILTLEEDNLPPPDGLIKLIEAMEQHPEYSAIGGLYWTKGEAGQPMLYGDPKDMPLSFRPQPPRPGEIVECNGLGMGFTLFRMDLFRDERIPRPWFETQQSYRPGQGAMMYTQDLYFFENARKAGHRFACHCGVLVGHYDYENDIVW